MTPEEITGRERSAATATALTTLGAVVLIVIGIVIRTRAVDYRNDRTQLLTAHAHSGGVIVAAIVQGIGFLMLAVPLVFRFRAAQARIPVGDRHSVRIVQPVVLRASRSRCACCTCSSA